MSMLPLLRRGRSHSLVGASGRRVWRAPIGAPSSDAGTVAGRNVVGAIGSRELLGLPLVLLALPGGRGLFLGCAAGAVREMQRQAQPIRRHAAFAGRLFEHLRFGQRMCAAVDGLKCLCFLRETIFHDASNSLSFPGPATRGSGEISAAPPPAEAALHFRAIALRWDGWAQAPACCAGP